MQQQLNGFSIMPCFLMPSEVGGYFYLPILSPFNQFPQIQCSSYLPGYNIPTPQAEKFAQIDSSSEPQQPSFFST